MRHLTSLVAIVAVAGFGGHVLAQGSPPMTDYQRVMSAASQSPGSTGQVAQQSDQNGFIPSTVNLGTPAASGGTDPSQPPAFQPSPTDYQTTGIPATGIPADDGTVTGQMQPSGPLNQQGMLPPADNAPAQGYNSMQMPAAQQFGPTGSSQYAPPGAVGQYGNANQGAASQYGNPSINYGTYGVNNQNQAPVGPAVTNDTTLNSGFNANASQPVFGQGATQPVGQGPVQTGTGVTTGQPSNQFFTGRHTLPATTNPTGTGFVTPGYPTH